MGLLVQMVGEHALEGLVTQTALIRFQPSVNPLVPRAVGAPPEGFATHPALKGLLLSVEPLVVHQVGAVTEGPAAVTALVQHPHRVQTPLQARAQEVFPVHVLRTLQRGVEPLPQAEPGDQAPEALAVLRVVEEVRAALEVPAAAALQGSLPPGSAQMCHVFETQAAAPSRFPRLFFCLETEAGLFFLNTHWRGIATPVLQAALWLRRLCRPGLLGHPHHTAS